MRQEQRTYWIFSSLKNFLRCQRCFLWGSKTKGEISMSGLVMVGIQVTFWHVSLLITWNLITMELSSFSAQPVQKSNHLVISDLWKIFQPPNELMWFSTPSKKYHEQKTKWESSRRDEHQRYVKPPSILGDVPASRVGLTVSKTSPRMMSDEASLGKYNSNISPLWKTLKLQNKTK